MPMTKGMYSTGNIIYSTPMEFFKALDNEFHFDVDVCAIAENAKCEHYYSPLEDGLKQEWGG